MNKCKHHKILNFSCSYLLAVARATLIAGLLGIVDYVFFLILAILIGSKYISYACSVAVLSEYLLGNRGPVDVLDFIL